jgi:SsrA-binding protein
MVTYSLNKKIRHDYEILETFEAGIVLRGHEVKSVKNGLITLVGSYIEIDKNQQVWLKNAHIPLYQKSSNLIDFDPLRARKLMLHTREIVKLIGKLQTKGLTAVPVSVYGKNNLIKVEVAIVKGKKARDKREDIKKRDIKRSIKRGEDY